jgi:hypothetical protein
VHSPAALLQSESEALLVTAAQEWQKFGDCQITPVIDLEQY